MVIITEQMMFVGIHTKHAKWHLLEDSMGSLLDYFRLAWDAQQHWSTISTIGLCAAVPNLIILQYRVCGIQEQVQRSGNPSRELPLFGTAFKFEARENNLVPYRKRSLVTHGIYLCQRVSAH